MGLHSVSITDALRVGSADIVLWIRLSSAAFLVPKRRWW